MLTTENHLEKKSSLLKRHGEWWHAIKIEEQAQAYACLMA